MTIKIAYSRMKSYENQNKDLKVKLTMYMLKKINKTALSSNNDKRLQNFGTITLHSYGTSFGKVC